MKTQQVNLRLETDLVEALVGGATAPGEGPELEGARTFLLSGPYAPRELTAKIDEELRRLLREAAGS